MGACFAEQGPAAQNDADHALVPDDGIFKQAYFRNVDDETHKTNLGKTTYQDDALRRIYFSYLS